MKTLKYKLFEEETNTYEISIEDFLEPHNKKHNCWWSNLPLFPNGIRNLKEHWEMSLQRSKEGNFEPVTPVTAKICPAIGPGILDKVFLVKTPTDISITVDKDTAYVWQSVDRVMNVVSHPCHQFYSEKDNPFDGYLNIKFELPVFLGTDNVPWMFLHPQYHNQNLPYQVLNGIVEGIYTTKEVLNINTIMKLPAGDEPDTHLIKAGTVLAYMWFPEKMKLVEEKGLFKQPLLKKFFGKGV